MLKSLKLAVLKLLFGGVDNLLALVEHLETELRAESAKLHAAAAEFESAAKDLRTQATKASNLAAKLG